MTMFARIKELAKNKDKNLKQVAFDMGFGENYFYTLKSQSPKAETLEKVADYFNVSVDYLLGRTDEKRSFYSAVSEDISDADTRTLQRAVNKMTPEERKKTIAILGAVFDGLFDSED
ncbi:helix-turn-helix domain-containing protein [Lysinibacillus sp. NPDC086135]|uniref:helix-turn-helix domain-containing protein n=1 Tax=Lysinibacillus sp. NPDC086135 TaxID=3364130 RepID=UPI0037F6E867